MRHAPDNADTHFSIFYGLAALGGIIFVSWKLGNAIRETIEEVNKLPAPQPLKAPQTLDKPKPPVPSV